MSRNKTEKAITQIPRELKKLTKVIAIIGETLIDTKITKIKRNEKEFRGIVVQENKGQGNRVVPNQKEAKKGQN